MDKLAFLDAPEGAEPTAAASTPAETPATAPEASAPPTETASDGRSRGPDGKFVSKAADAPSSAPEASSQAPATPPAAMQSTPVAEPAKAPEGYVPVSVVQAMREELNAYKRQPQQPPQPAPDPYEDFEAYEAHVQNERAMERAEYSRQIAELKHGPEVVGQAQQWAAERFASDPQFRERALSNRDPYSFAIAEYQRDQALQLLADPKLLEQFKAWQAGTGPAPIQQAAASAPPPQQPVAPPPSITSAPSAGGVPHVPSGPGQAYGSIFG